MNDILARIISDPLSFSVGAIIGAFSLWLLSYIFPAFLKFYYDAKLERFRRKLLQAEKAAVIADLIILARRSDANKETEEKINKCLLDLCLYLPPCLIHKLAHTVCRTGKNEDIGLLGLLVEIRQFMDGDYKADKKRKLSPDNIPLVSVSASAPSATATAQVVGRKFRLTQEVEFLPE